MKRRKFNNLDEITNYIKKNSNKKSTVKDSNNFILECTTSIKNHDKLKESLEYIKESIYEIVI